MTSNKGSGSGTSQPTKAVWNEVTIRPFTFNDVDALTEFYFHGPRESAFMQAIDFSTFPNEGDYRKYLSDIAINPAHRPTLAIEYRGRTIGVHYLEPTDAGQAEFQAQFFSAQDCGKGIGTISWFKACQYFFEHYKYDTIYFRAPKENAIATAAVKKLPLNFVGEEELHGAFVKPGLRARTYSLSREEFEAMLGADEADDEEESDL